MTSVRDAFPWENQSSPGAILLIAWRGGKGIGRRYDFGCVINSERPSWGIVGYEDIDGLGMAGTANNPAVYFCQRYYSQGRAVKDLLYLAAHTVLCGGQIDPFAIKGVEAIVCKRGQLKRLLDSEIAEILANSKRLDDYIAKQFGNAPDVIG